MDNAETGCLWRSVVGLGMAHLMMAAKQGKEGNRMNAHRIAFLRWQYETIIRVMADDILCTVLLQDQPEKLARYDLLMAQPRRDLQASLDATKAELKLMEA